MKVFQKIKLVFLSILVFWAVLNLIYWQVTPRQISRNAFPLKKERSFCVGANILDISTNTNGIILVKTKNTLSAYNQDSKSLKWMMPIKSQRDSYPSVATKNRVFVSDYEKLWSFNLTNGKPFWNVDIDNTDTWIPNASTEFVLLNSISNHIDVYNAISGEKLWSVRAGRGYTQAYIDQQIIYIIDRGIKSYNAVNGSLLWELNNNRATGPSMFDNGIIYYIEYSENSTYDLVAYNARTRSELWRDNFPDNGPDGLYIYKGFLFINELNVLHQIDLKNGIVNWSKLLSNPIDLSFIGEYVYVLEKFHKKIHALNVKDGKEQGVLQIALPKILSTDGQEMVSTSTKLVFTRGCEIFIYGN